MIRISINVNQLTVPKMCADAAAACTHIASSFLYLVSGLDFADWIMNGSGGKRIKHIYLVSDKLIPSKNTQIFKNLNMCELSDRGFNKK
jgi:hypothetical protein